MYERLPVRAMVGGFMVAAVACGGVAGAVAVGCSSGQTVTGPEGTQTGTGTGSPTGTAASGVGGVGTIGLALMLPGGDQVNSVTYTLTNGGDGGLVSLPSPNPGTVTTSASQSIDFQIGGVPAGTGDSITLSATTLGGSTCQGSASGITVTAQATQNITVQMICTTPGLDAGNLYVTGLTSYCGTWTSLSSGANGSEVYVGESIVLTATATGENPSNLGYTWTMSNPIGAFGAIQTDGGVGTPGQDEGVGPSDPMSFLCTSPGTTTITLVVDDGPIPDGGSCSTTLNTITTTVTCDAYPANQVESAWVELTGPNGVNGLTGNAAIARALTAFTTDGGNPCPTITLGLADGGTSAPQMNLRAAATTSIPSRPVNTAPGLTVAQAAVAAGGPGKPALFPVSSCEYPLPSGATSAVVAGRSLPLPKANPTKIVVIGDTGCRTQTNNGQQSCNDPNPANTDTPYPFAAIAAAAAAQNPDLVLHVGDYAYRDTECPAGLGYNCGGSPWGFGWDTWEADLFTPGAPLLAAAPWIMTRGNHEQCNRAGQGWYRFLDTQPFDTSDVHTCDNSTYDVPSTSSCSGYANCSGNWNNPFLVQINASTQIVVFDTANAKPQSSPALPSGGDGGVDGGPTTTGPGSLFFTNYANELTTAGNLVGASPLPFNFWSNHHPIFGYATGSPPANPIPLFPVVMNTVFPDTYFPPPINLALHGHTHDYQALNFQPGTGPDGGTFQPAATLVSGNAGDILDTALPYPLTGSAVSSVGNPTAVQVASFTQPDGSVVQEFATSDNGPPYANIVSAAAMAASSAYAPTDNDFGYMVLQFNNPDGGPATWTSTEYRWDNTVRDVCTIQATGQMSCASWGVILDDDAGVY